MEANDNNHDVDRGSQTVSQLVKVCLMKAKNVKLTVEVLCLVSQTDLTLMNQALWSQGAYRLEIISAQSKICLGDYKCPICALRPKRVWFCGSRD